MTPNEYHYTESGLDYVYLANGFEFVGSPEGNHVVIRDIDGLHEAIGLSIVNQHKNLTGQELRFLRHELLLSQAALARLLEVTDQTVARWEKGSTEIPKPAEAIIRLLYQEHVGDNEEVSRILKRIANLEDEMDRKMVLWKDDGEWEQREQVAA